MGHFLSKTTLEAELPLHFVKLVVEELRSSDPISNFVVDLSEDVTGPVLLQIFKGINILTNFLQKRM
jgi:hypothetical protein